MKNKLHVCCGEVYLKGYHNIDVPIPGYSFLAPRRPDILKINLTTKDKYYKFPLGGHPLKKSVADELLDITKADYPGNSFKEILMVSAFEHFSLEQAMSLLLSFYRWLKKGGVLFLDIPDIEASFKDMQKNRNIDNLYWNMRLIYGSQKNTYNFHKWGYTKEMLKKELTDAGFKKVLFRDIVEHVYPMIGVKAVK